MDNILFIVFQSGNRANGGVKSISLVMDALQGWNKYAISQLQTPVNDYWEQKSIKTTAFFRNGKGILDVLIFNWRVFKFCKKNKIKIVHCNDIDALLFAGIGSLCAKTKIVLNVRNIKSEEENYGFKWWLLTKITDRIIALSSEMKNGLVSRIPVPETKVSAIYSVVEKGIKIREKRDKRLVVGVCAAFMPRKKQYEFIKHCASGLINNIPDIKIQFVGDFNPEKDEYARKCLELVQEMKIVNSIDFVGYTNDVSSYYNNFDISLVVSEREGLARAMIESLAYGVPVISFDVCSASEILTQNDCGYVIKNGDYKELEKLIIEYSLDPDRRESEGERGKLLANNLFSKANVISQYNEVYHSLLCNN